MSKRETTTLPTGNAPYIDPNVNPERMGPVEAYAAGIAARRGAGLPKQQMPLNPPRPPIPTLTGGPDPHQGGGQTMADYARAERSASERLEQGYSTVMGRGSIIEEGVPLAPPPAQAASRVTPASLGLAPADLLPGQARNDPTYVAGPGSEYASNQPHLAAKYGVVRNGNFIPPQKLGSNGERRLSPETVQGLETLNRMKTQQAPSEEAPPSKDGLGASAAQVGNMAGGKEIDTTTVEEREELLRRAINQMDAFEFNQWRQLTMREILNSDEQRKIIESRLQPLRIEDMIMNGVIRQRVPIIPGKYEITLQSYDGQMELGIKRLVMEESRSGAAAASPYVADKYSFMSVAVGLHKVMDKTFPEVVDKDGNFSDDLFLAKFNQIMRLPIHMLASIGVNLWWFEIRVRKLYQAQELGNG